MYLGYANSGLVGMDPIRVGWVAFILLAHYSIRLDRLTIAKIEIVLIFIVFFDPCWSLLSRQSDKSHPSPISQFPCP
jgi:hypothetical protein